MGRLFDNPILLVVILLVILLLFGAPKLPGMARSLGQSMRIFKSEVKGMKDDDKDAKGENESTIVNGETVTETDQNGPNGSTAADGADGASTGAKDTDGSAR